MDRETQERMARNDAIFREANEQIRAAVEQQDLPLQRLPIICECPAPGCTEILRVPLDEYLAVRADPRRFLTAPGHREEEVGEVVAECDGYLVVEKTGPAARVAEELAKGDA
jgi:hypothetical protein